MKRFLKWFSLCLCVSAVIFSGCKPQSAPPVASKIASNRVVLYCSVDDVYAKPIIKDLEKQTGLKIDVLYDTEAAKTAGLANKIRAEKNRPQGDVFWSSALLQTLLLNREGLLQPYVSPLAKDIPAAFKAKNGSWTGLGVRARLIVHHEDMDDKSPSVLADLLDKRWRGKVGISNPQFGTASDWASALAVRWGRDKTLNYFRSLRQNGVRILPGNSVVAAKVGRRELLAGVTDSDDFFAEWRRAETLSSDGLKYQVWKKEAVFICGSVAILRGAPHPENARKLVDALLRAETQLCQQMSGVYPLHEKTTFTDNGRFGDVRAMRLLTPDDSAKWPAAWDEIREPLAEILLKN